MMIVIMIIMIKIKIKCYILLLLKKIVCCGEYDYICIWWYCGYGEVFDVDYRIKILVNLKLWWLGKLRLGIFCC